MCAGSRWRALAVAMIMAAASCGAPKQARVGETVPDYAAVALDGGTVSLSDLRGDVVLLNVWATWCAPCRAEMPAFERIHREQLRDGLRIVGVSIDAAGSERQIRRFLAEHAVTFQILLDPAGGVTRTFATRGVPETFLIGRDGTLLRHWTGRIDPKAPGVRLEIDRALAGTDAGY